MILSVKPDDIYLCKVKIETLRQWVKSVQKYKSRHEKDVNDVIPVSLLSTTTTIFNYYNYNHVRNILRLFDVLPNFPCTTSETMRDYYLWTWYIRVVSRVSERLKI